MNVMDRLDDYVLGPLNLIDRAEGLLKAVEHGEMGARFAMPRMDKGGRYSLDNAAQILARYGIAVFCRTHDADNIYFRVRKRQAVWAEYLLLNAGVELSSALIDPRNAQYVTHRTPGWMARRRNAAAGEAAQTEPLRQRSMDESRSDGGQIWQGLNRTMNWLLEE